MKIKFKKKRLIANLIISIIWIAFGTYNVMAEDHLRWTDYGYLVIGVLYFGQYLHDLTYQYLTIKDGKIKKNGLYGYWKTINLNDITWIKKFAGDYTLKTKQKELQINTDLIDKMALVELDKILAALNLPSNQTPFSNQVQ
ncbi:hypothetical protein JJL45_15815 [Tamlana sp. s12]|uniref:hypothetical protein n=1 Tax=Tamlana sp. s12 TaxID=1630406 RepID=UPI0007FCDA50|nr:hypothetical protein [Tamlana sp. s12]OBQ52245.1 hypothetical protein VQ01_14315 [Tamlana sp. s12]QQY82359.1 hypothetical protein JJL45_15815 [Tamlana sp. s12]